MPDISLLTDGRILSWGRARWGYHPRRNALDVMYKNGNLLVDPPPLNIN